MSVFDRLRAEPALVSGVVLALIAVASSFGLGITEGQSDAIVALVSAALPLVGAVVTRAKVTPVNGGGYNPEHGA